MNTLRLLIDPDWPQAHTDCAWFLHDQHGKLIQQGRSEPRHWPGIAASGKAEEPLACDLILSGPQCACFAARLPKGATGQQASVIAAALEESLLNAAEDNQFLPGPSDANGQTQIAVLSRARLGTLVQLLGELGLSPRSVWPEAWLLPAGAYQREGEPWVSFCRADGGFLCLDSSALNSAAPALAAAELTPPTQTLASAENARLWRAPALGGFLHGDFAPARERFALARHFRPTLRWLAIAGLLLALISAGESAWFAWQAKTYRQAIEASFRQAFPQAAMVDPVLQMQRQLDQKRQENGALASRDFLALLAQIDENELRVSALNYDQGRLQARLSLPTQRVDNLLSRLRQSGLAVSLAGNDAEGARSQLTLTLSPGDSQ